MPLATVTAISRPCVRHLVPAALLSCCVAMLASCAATATPRAADASARAVEASEIFARSPRIERRRERDGPLTQRREVRAANAQGRWELVLDRPTRDRREASALRTLRLERDAEGGVLLAELEDHEKRTVTIFDPPLRLMRRSVGATERQSHQTSLSVVDAAGRVKRLDAGTASAECGLVDAGGPGEEVEIVMRFDLSAATVEQRRIYAVGVEVDGRGVLREREELTVKLGFIRLVHESREWVPDDQ